MCNRRLVRRPWTLAFTALMGIGALGIGLVLWHTGAGFKHTAITEPLATIKFWSRVIRLALIILLGAAWPWMIRQRVSKNDARFEAVMRARWRVMTWLLVVELILGQSTGLLDNS